MTIWTPVERPGSRRTRSWVFDVCVALMAFLLDAPYVFAGNDVTSWPLWAAALIDVAMIVPLVVRRVWPVPVFIGVMLVAAGTGWWAKQVVWSPALVVALYTVAATRPRREAALACGVISVAAVVAADHTLPHNWHGAAGVLVAVAVAATSFGLYAGTRRTLLTELRDRAARLELERDQQVALAASAERARIAREMHDIVAHHLTVMVTLADGAAVQAARDPQRAVDAINSISSTGRLALGDTRRLLGVLRSDTDDSARTPLPDLAAMDELLERVRAAGLVVQYETTGAQPDVAPIAQLTVFRLVQEALTNTLKHGGAGVRAVVRIKYGVDEVHVQIDDDGVGSSDALAGAGRGLAGMRERVEAFGGELVAGPRSPRGWSVSARLRVDRLGVS